MEVRLDELALVSEPRLGAQHVAAIDLVLVQRHARDPRLREPAQVAQRPTDAAAAVKHQVVRLDAEPQREVVLVARDRGVETLASELVRKVERLAPALRANGITRLSAHAARPSALTSRAAGEASLTHS